MKKVFLFLAIIATVSIVSAQGTYIRPIQPERITQPAAQVPLVNIVNNNTNNGIGASGAGYVRPVKKYYTTNHYHYYYGKDSVAKNDTAVVAGPKDDTFGGTRNSLPFPDWFWFLIGLLVIALLIALLVKAIRPTSLANSGTPAGIPPITIKNIMPEMPKAEAPISTKPAHDFQKLTETLEKTGGSLRVYADEGYRIDIPQKVEKTSNTSVVEEKKPDAANTSQQQ